MREYIIQARVRPRGSAEQFQAVVKVVEARDMEAAERTFREQYETFGFFIQKPMFLEEDR